MKTQFINIVSSDNITHQGLLFSPENAQTEKIIIHIHGMAGNFYENSFIPVMAKYYTASNISFLTFNNRGHDYICDCKRYNSDGSTESFSGGTAYEVLEDCVFDIEGAIAFAKKQGYREIILQGHSSGANKVVYSMSKKQMDIQRVILISPCDDIGVSIDAIGNDRRTELLNLAKDLVAKGKSNAFMPDGAFFSYPYTAKAYLDSFLDGSALDMFPYRTPTSSFSEFASISVPMLVIFGNNGEFLLQDSKLIFDLLNQKKHPHAKLSCQVIDGAPHSYTSKENDLAHVIINWVEDKI